MWHVRIVLVQLPQILCGIIRAAAAERSDTEIVAELAEGDSIVAAVEKWSADAVVIGLPEGARVEQACGELLAAQPRTKVLGVTDAGRQVLLCELRPTTTALGQLSPHGLVEAIRNVVHPMSC